MRPFPLLIGAGVALVTGIVTLKISRNRASGFYTAFMAATAAVYVGSALAGDDSGVLELETLIAALLFAMALAGLWRSMVFTAAAFFLHGVWDMLHSWKGLGAHIDPNFPVLCVSFDWVIAGFIVYLETRGGTDAQPAATT